MGEEMFVSEFQKEMESLINRHSKENDSNTPDFILASYLYECLIAFNGAVRDREKWYGRNNKFPLPDCTAPDIKAEKEGGKV